jgi:predicted PurR-regulated permease PerM
MHNKEKAAGGYAQYLLPAFIVFSLVYFAFVAKNALFPFVLSAALAYILSPVIRYFEVRGIKRGYAVVALYLVAGIVLGGGIYLLVRSLSSELQSLQVHWPAYAERIQTYFLTMNAKLVQTYPVFKNVDLTGKLAGLLEGVPQLILALLPALTLLFIVPFITFFMLAAGSDIIDYILDHLPARNAELVLHIASRIDASLGNYLRGILTEAFVIFLIALAGLYLMDLNYAAVIAIVIGVSSMVPYLGAIVGFIVSSIVAYFQFGTLLPILKIGLFFGGIRFFDDWFLQPYIMKKAVALNPAVILLALMAGGEIGGIWGVIFSIPVTCIIKEIFQIAIELQETEFRWKPKPEPSRISIPYT